MIAGEHDRLDYAAKVLGVSHNTLRKYARLGLIGAFTEKDGSRTRITPGTDYDALRSAVFKLRGRVSRTGGRVTRPWGRKQAEK